jgi:hypothetical protein
MTPDWQTAGMDPTRVGVDFAVLADAAHAMAGKLYVLGGGWDVLRVARFPAVHHTMAIGMRISVPWTETDREIELAVMLVDEDGTELFERGPVRHKFRVRRPPALPEGSAIGVVRALTLNMIRFPREGSYSYQLTVDGEDVSRIPFRVAALPTPPSPPGSVPGE